MLPYFKQFRVKFPFDEQCHDMNNFRSKNVSLRKKNPLSLMFTRTPDIVAMRRVNSEARIQNSGPSSATVL